LWELIIFLIAFAKAFSYNKHKEQTANKARELASLMVLWLFDKLKGMM
jgi:hypothetical protein